MNLQKIFEAVKSEPDQPTLIVAVAELEKQGYEVKVADKYLGSAALMDAEENGELDLIASKNGVVIRLKKGSEEQVCRLHFLDIDAICFTHVETPPVMYNPDYTTGFYKSGLTN